MDLIILSVVAYTMLGYHSLTSPPSSLVYVLDENEVDEDLKVIFKVSVHCLLPLH